MSAKNKIIKLNSINRQAVDGRQCILLDNQQDSLSHIHRLALVPVIQTVETGESQAISFPDTDLILLNRLKKGNEIKAGLFPIGFQMQTNYGYLVLGIVPSNVILGLDNQSNFPQADESAAHNGPVEDGQHIPQVAREWIEIHRDWVQTNGILIYA